MTQSAQRGWNYRLVKFTDKNDYIHYEICEVFYKNGKPSEWSNRHAVIGQSLSSIKWTLKVMSLALTKPILEEKKIRRKIKLVEVI